MNSAFHEIQVQAREFDARRFNDALAAQFGVTEQTKPLDPARHRMTAAEAVPRAQLLALFDRSDARGQALLLQIAAIHASRYPKEG